MVGLLAIIVIVLDQVTKNWVLQALGHGETWSPIPGHPELLTLLLTRNTGTPCGYFPQTNVFFSFAPFLILAIVILFYRSQRHPGWLLSIGTGLIIGAAFGNLIDRLRLGFVVDFVQISQWPVFNVSDASVTTAVVLLLLWSLREESSAQEDGESATNKGLSWKLGLSFLILLGVLAAIATVICVVLPQYLNR